MFRHGRSLELKGVILLVILSALIWLSIAIYQKKFEDTIPITVHTQRAGLQLNDNGDVRMRGALVGRVADISEEAGEAVVHIELDAKQVDQIPSNVEARILPTTLFGQKYVELVESDGTSTGRVRAGARIPEDASAEIVEVTDAFDHLQPVLTAVRPQDLSVTLEAMAQALGGRGDKLGRLTVDAERLLERFESHTPVLVEDLRLLTTVSNDYADAMPDLLKTLRNATVTGETILDQESELEDFYEQLTASSKAGERFFTVTGKDLVTAGKVSRPLLELLARFSPEFPCVISGLVEADKRFSSAFYNNKLNSRTATAPQFPGYFEEDKPDFSETPTGPHCAGGRLPDLDLSEPLIVPELPDGGRWPEPDIGVVLP